MFEVALQAWANGSIYEGTLTIEANTPRAAMRIAQGEVRRRYGLGVSLVITDMRHISETPGDKLMAGDLE